MTKLSVNLNKVALLRNTRTLGIPSVARCAQICIEAGPPFLDGWYFRGETCLLRRFRGDREKQNQITVRSG